MGAVPLKAHRGRVPVPRPALLGQRGPGDQDVGMAGQVGKGSASVTLTPNQAQGCPRAPPDGARHWGLQTASARPALSPGPASAQGLSRLLLSYLVIKAFGERTG